MSFTQDFRTQRRNYDDGQTRIGELGRIWYDSVSNTLRIGDGETRGGVVISGFGATNILTNGEYEVVLGSDGTLTLPAGGTISYTPDDTDNWNEPAVNTVQAALDELATRVTALQNYEIDGGNAYTPPQGEFIIDGNGA
jgi:hypothetical protein